MFEEVKTIKKRTLIRTPIFVWALLAILLVLSTIGTTVWAKGGKPSPKPETFTYQIWIGSGDLVLEPYGKPEINYLLVEDIGYSESWLPPPKRGKYSRESWSVELLSLNPDGEPEDYCGTYTINNAELVEALGIDSGDEAYGLKIYHTTQNHPCSGENDYWSMLIAWQVGTLPSNPDIPHLHVLMVSTDMNLEPEGNYNKNTDTWTVTFETVTFDNAWVIENTESGEIKEIGNGQLNFTVIIERILIEST